MILHVDKWNRLPEYGFIVGLRWWYRLHGRVVKGGGHIVLGVAMEAGVVSSIPD